MPFLSPRIGCFIFKFSHFQILKLPRGLTLLLSRADRYIFKPAYCLPKFGSKNF
jgi:hypothetical protein